ncbi:MAG: hypothetical protein GYA34_09690 [Chloroflexi bacterium]|nr:hypothetical protein [Chloroflexota bacterium]
MTELNLAICIFRLGSLIYQRLLTSNPRIERLATIGRFRYIITAIKIMVINAKSWAAH